MASSYSSSLRLELPANGDQAGTWGTTLNNNLGTLIEQALVGIGTISVAGLATKVLTANNGVTDESRNAVLVFSGALTQACVVTIPSVKKVYVFQNTTTGAFALTIQTAGGGAITLLAGETKQMFCDGTSLFPIGFTSAGGAITGNMAISGTLSIGGVATLTSGGTVPTAAINDNTTAIANTAFVTRAMQLVYPIGSIYTNATVNTNPATLFGFGTWSAFGSGRVLIGDGGGYAAGATGGSADAVVVTHTHSFTGDVLPTHAHTYTINTSTTGGGGGGTNWAGFGSTTTSQVSGGTPSGTIAAPVGAVSGDNQNLQPYIVVYMWVRTA